MGSKIFGIYKCFVGTTGVNAVQLLIHIVRAKKQLRASSLCHSLVPHTYVDLYDHFEFQATDSLCLAARENEII